MDNMTDINKTESTLTTETTAFIANLKDAFGQWNKGVKVTNDAMIEFYKNKALSTDAFGDYESIEVYVLSNLDDTKALSTAKALWTANYYDVNQDKYVDYTATTKVLVSSSDTEEVKTK